MRRSWCACARADARALVAGNVLCTAFRADIFWWRWQWRSRYQHRNQEDPHKAFTCAIHVIFLFKFAALLLYARCVFCVAYIFYSLLFISFLFILSFILFIQLGFRLDSSVRLFGSHHLLLLALPLRRSFNSIYRDLVG